MLSNGSLEIVHKIAFNLSKFSILESNGTHVLI